MTLHLTALFAGLLILVQIALTTMVGVYRGKVGINFLHGDDDVLLKRMRAHGNFTETVPITLIAMALAELAGAPSWLLLAGGSALVLGRLTHAMNFMGSAGGLGAGRAVGMAMTTISMLAFAIYGLMIFGGVA
jgi:uncharacterized protein